jgi:hypothetical protein
MGLRAYQIGLAGRIQTRIDYWVTALSQIQYTRNPPLEAIQKFSAKQLKKFLKDINANRELHSYRVEFRYLYMRLQGKQITERLPEQKLLGKRALVFKIGFLVPWLIVE